MGNIGHGNMKRIPVRVKHTELHIITSTAECVLLLDYMTLQKGIVLTTKPALQRQKRIMKMQI